MSSKRPGKVGRSGRAGVARTPRGKRAVGTRSRMVTAVILDRDVVEQFGDSRRINEVLRSLIKLMSELKAQAGPGGRAR